MEPVSRIEKYLDRMANGGSGDLPAPVSRIEHYLAQIAEGGAGGGLPAPTASDVGKTLTVGSTPTKGAVIVPEQTLEGTGDYVPVSDGVPSLFTVGTSVIATINNEDYFGVVTEEDSVPIVSWVTDDGSYLFDIFDGVFEFLGPPDMTCTVSLYVSALEYAWTPADPALVNYDVVIRCDTTSVGQLTDDKIFLVKGSYADCLNKIRNKHPIAAYVYAYSDDGQGFVQFSTIKVIGVSCDSGYHDDVEIYVLGGGNDPSATVRNSTGSDSLVIYNTNAVRVTLYLTESGLSVSAPWD